MSTGTREVFDLPKNIKLTRYQSYRLKDMVKSGAYLTNLKFVHAGRIVYFQHDYHEVD